MNAADLEDLALWLIAPEQDCPDWLDIWAAAYPTAYQTLLGAPENRQEQLQAAFDGMPSENASNNCLPVKNIAVVAFGAGVPAFAEWLYRADIQTRKSVRNIILVTPPPAGFSDGLYTHEALHASCPCRAALVIGTGNSEGYRQTAARLAAGWKARLLTAPDFGRLNAVSGGWEWGMKLMQEMLLSD
ncbi:MAG: alpha/beta hydrolase [Neisseria sp.]|nr:alpha/beta hydrolase [Neisseria sp.]